MGIVNHQSSVAILIRQAVQWPEALRAGRAFAKNGAVVKLFCLGMTPMTMDVASLETLTVECYADTCQIGMSAMPLCEIARKLKQCDWVIPL